MTASTGGLQELKSRLWNCAEILRGSAVDRTDWKAYILPLLFFKRISDVWDEEYENRSNVVDTYVRYLRNKVDRPFGVESIETVRGHGYRLKAVTS